MPTWIEPKESPRERVDGRAAPVVLIAENDEALRACMAEALTEAGYQVVTACDCHEVVSALRLGPVGLLITDLVIPEQKGIETILHVRRHFPDLKVIAIASADPIHLEAARKLGACAVLYEPFSSGDLVRTTECVCGRGSQPEGGTPGTDNNPSSPEPEPGVCAPVLPAGPSAVTDAFPPEDDAKEC